MPQEQLPARPLFVRGLNWLGDAVMSLPALNALVNSGQTLKVLTRIGSASLYRNVSGVSEVLVEQKSFMGRLKTCLTLTQERFSGALVLPNSFSSALTAFLGLIPSRVGYARNIRSPLLSKAVPVRRRDLAVHQSFYFLRLVEAMGLAAPFTRPQINPPQTPFPIALPSGFRLAIAPGAAYGGAKRWPAEKFAEAARLILANHPGTAVILGGPSEIIAAQNVAKDIYSHKVINLAGQTSLGQAISVLSQCHLTLANDSGLMHLSGALDVPVVAIFGPTNPLTTAPLSRRRALLRRPVDCAPCLGRECLKPTKYCFEGLTPFMVAEAAEKLLAPVQTSRGAIFWTPTQDDNWPTQPLPPNMQLVMAVSDLESLGLLDSSFPPGTLLIPRPLLETRDHIGFLKNHDLNPAASFWMGDIPRSLEGASRFGGRTILIMTSRAQDSLGDWFKLDFTPDLAAPDPQRAIEWISSLMI